jgi:hypothetical protein
MTSFEASAMNCQSVCGKGVVGAAVAKVDIFVIPVKKS